jgi:FtsZ-binding cell division protein ZapB
MTEKKPQWELTGLERFGHLEDKLFRVVEAFKAIRKENETLRAENQRLKIDIESLRSKESGFNESLGQLQEERENLRERVEKALGMLASLEIQ